MKTTDWTKYYNAPYKTASLTRKITGRIIVETLKKYFKHQKGIILTEIGGANSAFLELLIDELNPSRYVIIDNNLSGLEKTKQRIKKDYNVVLLNKDILNCDFENILSSSDLVLSIGLIEHFDKNGTQRAIKAHFDLLKPDGYAVITFPTPTFLYRIARFIAEKLGLWIFHDERPLLIEDVLETAMKYGEPVEYRIIWPIIFTQGLVVFKKKQSS
ncbi:MAG: class I SAM-dependent methyltransferase [Deltaproteobacteria bacterium]|nr:class I SAM-dependent methyltransferase [Deltaproteobacteria bacterium]